MKFFCRILSVFVVCFLLPNILHSLPKCPNNGNPNSWDNCFGYVDLGGQKIEGDWKGGEVVYGTFSMIIDGDEVKYTGDMKNWEMHGIGEFTSGKGGRYIGEIRNNNPHGEGIAKYPNGAIMEGVWRNGKFQYAKKHLSL